MVRIGYRDVAQLAGPLEISRELSDLAEACLLAASSSTRPAVVPLDCPDPLGAIGLGKLASRQMHYGSDLDLLFLYALISAFAGCDMPLLLPLFVAEVSAKVAMITVIAFGRSLGPGMGAMVIAAAKKSHYAIGLIIAWAAIAIAVALTGMLYDGLPLWRIGLAGIAAMLSPLAVAAIVTSVSNRNFGGVNGDVMGTANEIGRIAALTVMGVVLWMHF
jgi:hypothetical protein